MKKTKDEYIQRFTKDQHKVILQRYYWVANKWKEPLKEIIRIPIKVDKKFSTSDYENMYNKSIDAMLYFHQTLPDIQTALDPMQKQSILN